MASGSILLVYLGVSLAVIQLRRKQGMPTAGQFCIPGGPLVPIPSSLFVIWLLAQMTASEALGLGGMLVFALGLYFARYVYQRRGSKRASEAN
ncbi:MAG: hypothetical protein SH820_13060 [Xanthomonadales bacterium]|nr:hypothetical protein [Xanthomonadales bacterium]